MTRRPTSAIVVLVLSTGGAWPCAASDGAASRHPLLQAPVSDGELGDMRGGFFTAAGAQFDFGATVTTTINGQLALQTNLTWTPAGVNVQQLSGLGASIQAQVASSLAKAGIADPVTAPVPAAAPASTQAVMAATLPAASSAVSGALPSVPASTSSVPAPSSVPVAGAATATTLSNLTAAAGPGLSGASLSTTVGGASATAAPAPITVATITNIVPDANAAGNSAAAPAINQGVQIQTPTGTTQVLANLGANQLQNIVVNSASNQTIVQNTNLVFTIYNFADWQKQMSQNAISTQLANEVMSAAGLGR